MTVKITLHGTCDERFTNVCQAFQENFIKHGDIGAALAVSINGRKVADLWGGYANIRERKPWKRDTIVNVWSVTKAIVALCALRLVNQKKLDLDLPVAQYWPEFAIAGKDTILVRHLLSHQAGLAAITKPLPTEAVFDWQVMTEALAAQKPWWTPGTGFGYHAATFGWLVGELVRRVSGKSLGTFLQEEIAKPLNIDFLIGFGPEQDYRVAEVLPPPSSDSIPPPDNLDPNSIQAKLNNPPLDDFDIFNSRIWREAEIPSANGTTNARALARLYGALACGGTLDNIQIIDKELLMQAISVASTGTDLIFGHKSCIGLGFALNDPPGLMGPNSNAYGHAGYGGSIGFADPKTGVGFGYTVNQTYGGYGEDPRVKNVLDALYSSL